MKKKLNMKSLWGVLFMLNTYYVLPPPPSRVNSKIQVDYQSKEN